MAMLRDVSKAAISNMSDGISKGKIRRILDEFEKRMEDIRGKLTTEIKELKYDQLKNKYKINEI